VRELLDELPPESRAFAGNDPESFERFVDALMRDGSDDIAARMQAPDREDS
jgi:exonuclease SbcD